MIKMRVKLIYLSCRNIFNKKARSVLCIVSVMIGVFSVMFLSFFGDSGAAAIDGELKKSGIGGLLIYNENNDIIPEHVARTAANSEAVQETAPVTMAFSAVKGFEKVKCISWAIDERARELISVEAVQGRYFNNAEFKTYSCVCMIDEALEKTVFKNQSAVGETLNILIGAKYYEFEVVGIVKTGGGILQNFTSYIPSMIFFPQYTFSRISGITGYTQIAVGLNAETDAENAKFEISRRLNDIMPLKIENLAKQKENLNKIAGITTTILSSVGMISVFVAGIGIMTTMLMSAEERKREIGIKKAIGAGRGDIVAEFLGESVILMLIGFILGLVIAIPATIILAEHFKISPEISIDKIGFFFMVTILLGIVFGGYPAYKAASMNPSDALTK